MSIRAMNWAMAARTDGVSAQCVLYIVADTANEHGVSVHADPDYIATRTRQSRATVFRRLKELEAAGALTRFKRFRDDGAPIYEIRLHLATEIDYANPPDDDGTPQDIEGESQIETQAESQNETGGVAPVRQAKSQSCDSHMSPSKNPKEESPLPPKGGETQHPPDFENRKAASWAEFETAWQEPILRQSIARQVWWALTEAEEPIAIKAAKGYVVYRRSQNKPPSVINAHTFLRERDAWVGFAAHAPLPPPPPSPPPRFISADSDEFKASCVLDVLRGEAPRLPIKIPEHGIGGMTRNPQTPLDVLCLAPFADVDRKTWFTMETETHRHQVGAWNERVKDWTGRELKGERLATGEFKELLGNKYPIYKTVFRVPCEWPPRKDGTWSTTGPPVAA